MSGKSAFFGMSSSPRQLWMMDLGENLLCGFTRSYRATMVVVV
jgi:hypothetical protein